MTERASFNNLQMRFIYYPDAKQVEKSFANGTTYYETEYGEPEFSPAMEKLETEDENISADREGFEPNYQPLLYRLEAPAPQFGVPPKQTFNLNETHTF
jgi:hypothetical protein